ncbi:MAG: CopG family transcriptional regulator [Sphaerospermopsis sp. SIO1G2]|nr:CopG family transcriptional regulator [Sphaerospermopsis sp. SIO1G1]NET74313.1 CopG family transcriptional regulator [Sphaerospermopsis sp. SIO1G2]
MNNISTDELEQKIATGEEIIDQHFDPKSTKKGTKYLTTVRRSQTSLSTQFNLPQTMLKEIEEIASELNITPEAVIKMILRRALDEHYLAKSRTTLIVQ